MKLEHLYICISCNEVYEYKGRHPLCSYCECGSNLSLYKIINGKENTDAKKEANTISREKTEELDEAAGD